MHCFSESNKIVKEMLAKELLKSLPIMEQMEESLKNYSKETPLDYNYADMYAFSGSLPKYFHQYVESHIELQHDLADMFEEEIAFTDEELRSKYFKSIEDKSATFFAKKNQSWNYVIAFIRDENKKLTNLIIREFWDKTAEVTETLSYDSLMTEFAEKELTLSLLSKAANMLSEYSDDLTSTNPKRPGLDYLIKHSMSKYSSSGIIADFVFDSKGKVTIDGEFDYKKLLSFLSNIEICIEEI